MFFDSNQTTFVFPAFHLLLLPLARLHLQSDTFLAVFLNFRYLLDNKINVWLAKYFSKVMELVISIIRVKYLAQEQTGRVHALTHQLFPNSATVIPAVQKQHWIT